MNKLDLSGSWLLSWDGGDAIPGHLPGCTYLDLMANGLEDPFKELNETASTDLAKREYTYSRNFMVSDELLSNSHIDFVGDGIDTLCDIYINEKHIAYCDNIHRTYRLDVKDILVSGYNKIKLVFHDPYKYVEEHNAKDPLPKMGMQPGIGHIRKTQSNFGWDWGPALAPAGVTRSIGFEAYDEKIDDVIILQHHSDGKVVLDVTLSATSDSAVAALSLTDPDGNTKEYACDRNHHWTIDVENPRLWWCNAFGEQPLYKVSVSITAPCADDSSENNADSSATSQAKNSNIALDSRELTIGLRKIELDTHKDEDGRQFKFIINDVPLFIHGADWIPADSFITRADRETIDFYIKQMKNAGMNLVRVWGGGTYETEHFYDACDKYGILVWQDCGFACSAYPFYEEDFVESVHKEVIDNVKRLRHRASLAIWCGNNENEMMAMFWKKNQKVIDSNIPFYYNILGPWIKELDTQRDFWPGSPSSGVFGEKVHSLEPGKITGDTHLWQVWHGMQPIEAYRNFPTRMCTEFGMESMPSMKAIRSITKNPNPELLDPVMLLHQKSDSGNQKMLYYLLAKYRNPAKFEDFVYLSQLVQSGGLRFASDTWRRNIGKQNGAVYWQMNDCWPVASWSAIDYLGQPKAVLYHAKQFNKPLAVINDYYKDYLNLYVVNEYPSSYEGELVWKIKDFSGNEINCGKNNVIIGGSASINVTTINFSSVLKGRNKKDVYIEVCLSNADGVQDTNAWLLVPDKDSSLPKVDVTYTVSVENGVANFEFTSKEYARYVFLEADSINAPWSDNFFDIMPGETKVISVPVDDSVTAEIIKNELKIKTLTDVVPKGSAFQDKWIRFKFWLRPSTLISALIFKMML